MEKLKMAIAEYCKESCTDCRFYDTCTTVEHNVYKRKKRLCYDKMEGDLIPTEEEKKILCAIFDAAETVARMPTKNMRRKWRGVQLGLLIAYEILSGVDAYIDGDEIKESITGIVICKKEEADDNY